MSKTKIFILIQAVITFVIGIILSAQGINISPDSIALNAGEKIAKDINDTSNSQDISSVANDFEGMFQSFGFVLSALSIIEFIFVLAWIILFKK